MADASVSSVLVFAGGFIFGQVCLGFAIVIVVKFFIFGGDASSESLRPSHSPLVSRPNLSHKRSGTFKAPLRGAVSTLDILQKTSYDPASCQPESLGWFNVLVAQTLAQIRLDALDQGVAIRSLESVLNGPSKPGWVDDIKVTEMNLGEAFPIFSNCRITPVDDSVSSEPFGALPPSGNWDKRSNSIGEATRLQAQIDVQLNDVITLGVQTKIVLNYPKPLVATLPVALAVSVVSFSGTILLSLVPVSSDPLAQTASSSQTGSNSTSSGAVPPSNAFPSGSPNSTALTFTLDPSYTLSLRTTSLVGSRARLTDVPKLAQIIESRIRSWFHDRVVYPRFQQVALPSLWPRMKNARGGEVQNEDEEDERSECHKRMEAEMAVEASMLDRQDSSRLRANRTSNPSTEGLRWRGSLAPVA